MSWAVTDQDTGKNSHLSGNRNLVYITKSMRHEEWWSLGYENNRIKISKNYLQNIKNVI